jgi:polyphosphate glucokinase
LKTLAIDIGGTGVKALILDIAGTALTERARVETPQPATPDAVLAALFTLIEPLGDFDRVSVGFPGVVVDGVTMSAPTSAGVARLRSREAVSDKTRRPTRAQRCRRI